MVLSPPLSAARHWENNCWQRFGFEMSLGRTARRFESREEMLLFWRQGRFDLEITVSGGLV